MHRFAQVKAYAKDQGWAIEREGEHYLCWPINEWGMGPTDGLEHPAETLDDVLSMIAASPCPVDVRQACRMYHY